MKRLVPAVLALVLLAASMPARACSTFCATAQDGLVFGKNYDWNVEDGLLIVNRRGVRKTAITDDNPAEWMSKYGSISFNQYGREFPSGGMNEAGLVIELMWLDGSAYPEPDERPRVGGGLQWIQYQLDTSGSVADVVASDADIRIGQAAPLHFMVADRSGRSAAIEFLNGRMIVHSGDDMPARALTNSTYESSIRHLKTHKGFGGKRSLPRSSSSLDRFVRAAAGTGRIEGQPNDKAIDEAFRLLAEVAQGDQTKWSIVYDVDAGMAHFRTLSAPSRRFVALADLDFACTSPVRYIDLGRNIAGDVSGELLEFSRPVNRRLIAAAYRQTSFLKDTPEESIDEAARYPESMTCDETP